MNNFFTKQEICKIKLNLKLILSFILLLGCSNTLLANGYHRNLSPQISNLKISTNIENKTLNEALTILCEEVHMFYGFHSATEYNKSKKYRIDTKGMVFTKALGALLNPENLDFTVEGNKIIITPKTIVANLLSSQQEKLEVAGTVLDSDGAPVIGATVLVTGTTDGAITDNKGTFVLSVADGGEIVVSATGFIEQKVIITKQNTNLKIKLVADEMAVEDVVVTGYFNKKKETYTGAVTVVSGEQLRTISTGNVLSSLSMLDPSFVQVDNNIMGSDPNSIPDFEIRGSSSLKGQFEGNPNMPTFIMDGFEVSAIKVYDLDPHRIKSMSILKDAAATAIYGSRAANGVVVIETIAPKAGELRISYSGSLDLEVADLSGYDLMNSAEKVEYEFRAGLFDPTWNSAGAYDTALEKYNTRLKLVAQGYDTEWYKLPVKDVGIGQKHSVNVEGGSDTFRYGINVYYSNKTGVMKGSDRNTYGGSISLNYNLKNLKFSNYSSFDHTLAVNSPYGSYSEWTMINPYYYPYEEDGSVSRDLYTYQAWVNGILTTQPVYNPLYNTTLPSKNESKGNSFINNFSIEYDIMEGFKLKGTLGLTLDNSRTDNYLSNEHTSFVSTERENRGSYNYSNNDSFSYDTNITLSYFKNINKHSVNAGLVYNSQQSTSDALALSVIGFPNINMDHLAMGTAFPEGYTPTGDYTITRMLGFALNAGYTYDNKYLFDLSVRSDASSVFGSNNRWGTFWSIGTGWNIHKESFLEGSSVINNLKLRGSIGTTGGQSFSPYQALTMFRYDTSSGQGAYDGYLGAVMMGYGNENLKWQVTNKRNIGIDFDLFDSKLSGSVNYYSDLTEDALIDVTVAPILGFSSYMENLGNIRNKGIEVTLKATVIKNTSNNFRWDVMFNAAHNKNEVVDINDALKAFNEAQDEDQVNGEDYDNNRTPSIRYGEGLSQNTIWANESLGIDPRTGEEIFLDMNGEIVGEWSTNNYKPLGCSDPKLFGSFGTMLSYGKFDFNVSMYYRFGGDIYNQTLVSKIEDVNPNYNGDRRILTDRWNDVGDIAKYKKVSDSSVTLPTSRFIERENYIQLQSVSLGYNLFGDDLKSLGIERIKVNLIGNDIFTVSTVKMERGISYPFARTISMSLQVTF